MRTPDGHLKSIVRRLAQLSRYGDEKGFDVYVCSAAFFEAFAGLDPARRHTALRVYAKTSAECQRKTRTPLRRPLRMGVAGANWRDPAMRAKLAAVYAKTSDHNEAARLLGVTPGSARQAKRTYLDATATMGCALAA